MGVVYAVRGEEKHAVIVEWWLEKRGDCICLMAGTGDVSQTVMFIEPECRLRLPALGEIEAEMLGIPRGSRGGIEVMGASEE